VKKNPVMQHGINKNKNKEKDKKQRIQQLKRNKKLKKRKLTEYSFACIITF